MKRALLPASVQLNDEQVLMLEKMIEEDDKSLKTEFHVLRLYFARAIAQLQNANNALATNSSADLIDELRRLAAVLDRLSTIAERGARIKAMTPQEEQIVRVQFDNPRIEYLLKERIRSFQSDTIRRVLAIVLAWGDPDGKLGLAQRLPPSFAPFLPSNEEPNQLPQPQAEQSKDNVDRPFAAVEFPEPSKE